jgi:hypothetical protein
MVGFDGLRSDAVTRALMPRLWGFTRDWCLCLGHRAVFPSETYVNHPSIFTGAYPRGHGVIANLYPTRPGTSGAPFFLGSRAESVRANDRAGGGAGGRATGREGGLINVPTLGQRLARSGRTMRVIGSNSPGSTLLKHHRAADHPGHLVLPVRDLAHTAPASEREAYARLHGPGIPLAFPDLEGSRAVVDSFFQVEIPRGLADVTVLWIGEPDHSSHVDGPDGEKTRAALAHADSMFGLILDWWRAKPGDVQLAALSDHGHVVVGRRSDLKRRLRAGGLKVVTPLDGEAGWGGAGLDGEGLDGEGLGGADPGEADLIMAGDYCAGLWAVRPGDFKSLRRAAEILMDCPDLGTLHSIHPELYGGPDSGILPESLLLSDHGRSPDLRLMARGDPATGLVAAEGGDIPVGGGVHGGLLPQELGCLCAFGGSLFKRETANTLPSGPADVTPTMARALGLDGGPATGFDGRVLEECFEGGAPDGGSKPRQEAFTRRRGGFRQILRRTVYQDRIYLDHGCRED